MLYKPWGYKFRKARFVRLIAILFDYCYFVYSCLQCFRYVYVPEDENSSKSIEIERVMKEARLRELVRGVYSSSYGNDVPSMVNFEYLMLLHRKKP